MAGSVTWSSRRCTTTSQPLLADAAAGPPASDNELEFELSKIRLISQARVVLDIIEAQSVHTLRSSLPQPSYGEIGDAQGISKQAAGSGTPSSNRCCGSIKSTADGTASRKPLSAANIGERPRRSDRPGAAPASS